MECPFKKYNSANFSKIQQNIDTYFAPLFRQKWHFPHGTARHPRQPQFPRTLKGGVNLRVAEDVEGVDSAAFSSMDIGMVLESLSCGSASCSVGTPSLLESLNTISFDDNLEDE